MKNIEPATKLLGIDEAGRGCVIGPMCLAGVVMRKEDEALVSEELGCRDSKIFGSSAKAKRERERIAGELKKRFPCFLEIVPARVIDEYVNTSSLNRAEIDAAGKILSAAEFDLAVLDGRTLFGPLTGKKVVAVDKADRDHPCVAAASIIAKDARDRELDKIFGKLKFPPKTPGGGYANARTLALLVGHFEKHGRLPEEYRQSFNWAQLQEALQKYPEQTA